MQTLNWNDLRFILAISRGRTLAAAARLLDVDDTTVARRLAAVQEATGARLCQRLADGTLQLTSSGERALLHAERIEREVSVLDSALSGNEGEVAGTVRVTSVPIIVNRMLVPASQAFLKRHPSLRLELVGDARDFSLTRREADLALRLGRPKTGGMRVTARRVGTLRYEVYASAAYSAREARTLPWITYDEAMAHLPQVAWIAANAAQRKENLASVRVNDAEGVVEAVLAGLGRSLLPCMVADRDARLARHGASRGSPALTRELWLLMHSELKKVRGSRRLWSGLSASRLADTGPAAREVNGPGGRTSNSPIVIPRVLLDVLAGGSKQPRMARPHSQVLKVAFPFIGGTP